MAGEADNAFCAVRPPGHHAEPSRAMGFCLFNNVAVAALHARAAHGAERVAVVDFDVHHGNGTQAAFWSDKDLFYGSTHQMPLFPGTGAVDETGVGNIFNAPLKPGDDGDDFREAFEARILPALDAFAPDFLLISAGFDAHRRDPLAQLRLVEADFAWVTEKLVEAADKHCGGKLVSTLEGGYDLEALGKLDRRSRRGPDGRRPLERPLDWKGGKRLTRIMAEPTDHADIKTMSFEQALKELETIVDRLEKGDVELEASILIYERGEALKTHCDALLRKAEARVEKISLNQNGQPTGTEPLDVED